MAGRQATLVVLVVALVVLLAALAASGWAIRSLYLRSKLALAEPVHDRVYEKENRSLRAAGRGPQPRVVAIGDSRIRRWPLEALAPDAEVINRGIGGETAAQLVYRFTDDCLALEPEVVILQAGINDLVAAWTLPSGQADRLVQRTAEHLQALARAAHEAGARVILMTIIPPSTPSLARRVVWSDELFEQVQQVNARLLEWEAPAGVTVLDTAAVFGGGRLPREFREDALHLNADGYERLRQELAPLLRGLLETPPGA